MGALAMKGGHRLWASDDIAECGGRADPSEDHAGNHDDGRRARCVDARDVARSEEGHVGAVAFSRTGDPLPAISAMPRQSRNSVTCPMI
jgi:hypothetical protein